MELLIVMVLLGILLAIAVPQIRHITTRSRVNQSSSLVAADLAQAMSLAARSGRPLTLAQEDPSQYSVRDRNAPPNDTLRLRRNLRNWSDFGVMQLDLTPASVTFYPTGTTSATLVITLTSDGYTRQITMTTAGQIQVVTP